MELNHRHIPAAVAARRVADQWMIDHPLADMRDNPHWQQSLDHHTAVTGDPDVIWQCSSCYRLLPDAAHVPSVGEYLTTCCHALSIACTYWLVR